MSCAIDRKPVTSTALGVLITRPEPGAQETARAVQALGWLPILAPALTLTALPQKGAWPRAQALLLTSRAAARALTAWPIKVFAVGKGTAAEAAARGFTDITAAAGDAASLTEQLSSMLRPEAGALCLAVGEGYGLELAAALRGKGFRVIRRVVYAARPAPSLPAEAQAALQAGSVHAALFTSPRAVRESLRLLRAAGLSDAARGVIAIALSTRIATALAPLPWAEIRVAAQPDHTLLLRRLGAPDMLGCTP